VPEFGTYDFQLSSSDEDRAARLHAESTIVDVIWWGPLAYQSFTPQMNTKLRAAYERHHDFGSLIEDSWRLPGRLAVAGELPEYRRVWDASGVTAGHCEIQVGDPRLLLEGIAHVDYLVDHLPWLRKALRSADFRTAKHEGGHALYLQCQPTPPISRDFSLIDLGHDAGLRVLQLSYNVQDAIACGCADRSGAGLSRLGVELIARLNKRGIIVDTAHCNQRTVLDACKASAAPVIVSHTSAAAVHPHDRGISDESAEAIAASGGIIGVVAHPAFLGPGRSTIETMLDHIEHFTSLVGWQHVAIGSDWPMGSPKWVLEEAKAHGPRNGFRKEHGIDPTRNLLGFDDYRDHPNITRGLVSRGYRDDQIKGILGENFLRVFAAVCD
jgi:membrane dipeptidase